MNKLKNIIKKVTFILITTIVSASFAFTGCSNECYYCNNGESLGITYSGTVKSTNATCTQGGQSKIQCPHCARTKTIEVDALGHDFKISKDEATCLKAGWTYYTCSRTNCYETKSEWNHASSAKHDWKEISSKSSVSYTNTSYKCSICEETKSEKTKISMGSQVKNTEETFYYATAAAISIVKKQLKYPSSAKFLQESQMEVHYNYSDYFIEGAVSAPNAFGVYKDFYFIVRTKIRVSGSKFTWYDYACELEE